MKEKFKVSSVFIYGILSVWALTTIFPLVWAFMNSFKDRKKIASDSFSIPIGKLFTFDNYKELFDAYDIWGAYGRSLIISVSVAIFVILFGGMAAYILARYKFFGKGLLNALIYAAMMFPIYSTIIPVYTMEYNWGLTQNGLPLLLLAVILPQIAGNMAFSIIVLRAYMQGLPVELEEAAYMEGCNIFQIFFKVILPLSKPSFVTVGIFGFLWSYNDLFTQMFFLRSRDQFTITRLLNEIAGLQGINYGKWMASVSVIVVPVLIVYLALQKYIIKGMTVGAVKG